MGAVEWRPNGAWDINYDFSGSKRDQVEDAMTSSLTDGSAASTQS